ncbi:MAG: Rpn family recombination-promoting nuclease/putative transposase [Cyanobacteria bacterium]|nr:Rpn family recombination-promoting nuclease/putative transposase [Cyanobacteriota bacterium]
MAYYLQDKYISLLTDFGFKRVFGTEPNKAILIDFLNTLLPDYHHIKDLTFKNTEKLGNTPIDRKAIFDIYCQAENGDHFIVEIQKAKQNFFKDRSVYYSTFPIQEQALQGEWDFNLTPVYTVGVLDFIFDDHKNDDTIVHLVQLRNQNGEIFYDKLKFIYIELPKFKKTIDQLETHLDKWLFILRNLANLSDPPPESLQETVFSELFEVAAIANFSRLEQDSYQNSLKYYRDMNNVVDTARQEGVKKGLEEGRLAERSLILNRQRSLILRLLSRTVGELTNDLTTQINQLPIEKLEALNEILLDFKGLDNLVDWLKANISTL